MIDECIYMWRNVIHRNLSELICNFFNSLLDLLLSWASAALDHECNSSADIVTFVKSEPADNKCLRNSEGSRDWLTIISFIVALLAMVIATFSMGIDSKCFQDEKQAEDDVPYIRRIRPKPGCGFGSYRVFDFEWTIDVGWTSTWVRIVNEWLAVCVYSRPGIAQRQ
ncbi:probable serine incorporator [Tanacetum coccineum]